MAEPWQALSVPGGGSEAHVIRRANASRSATARAFLTTMMAAASLLPSPSASGAAACPAARRFDLRVHAVDGDIAQDTTVGVANLQRLAGAERAAAHFPLLGMSGAHFVYAVAMEVDTVEGDDGLICALPKVIDVRVGYVDRTVFIVREAASDACLYRAVLDHELRQAHADDDALNRWLPSFPRRLRASIERLEPLSAPNPALAKKNLNSAVDAHVRDLLRFYDKDHNQAQAAVDTPEELLRLRHACQGKGQRLLAEHSFPSP